MHGHHSSFPAGGAGAGLLLLRVAVAAHLLLAAPSGDTTLAWWWLMVLALAVALLGLGLLTPLAAGACAAAQLSWLGGADDAPALIGILCALALLLLGPGAYGLDARLFGRRRLLPPADPFDVRY
ncbi:MAG TPA: hypothetical protein VFT05_06705 [Burkholderiaceae bacterium]|nr:hypothetical protein [Burkholderiaceae bacterium]